VNRRAFRNLVIYLRVALGLAGCLATLAGLVACLLFGLLPLLQAIDESNLALALALGWFTGAALATNFVGLVRERNLRANRPDVYIVYHDLEARTWTVK
jgi:hypothetical protein